MVGHSRTFCNLVEPDDDKLLFAEDVVSHFMNKVLWENTPFNNINVAPISGPYRTKVYNAFNETIRKAVDIIYVHLHDRIRHRFFEIAVKNTINYASFRECESDIRNRYFPAGVDAIRFLKYCVFLAVLAGKFYECVYKSTPDMATSFIVKAFPCETMSRVTWDTLNMAAKGYAKKYQSVLTKPSPVGRRQDADSDLSDSFRLDPAYYCGCFQAEERGRSFKAVFKNRNRVLKYHKEVCLRKVGINLQRSPSLKTKTPKRSGCFPDFLLEKNEKTQNCS